MIVSTFSDTKNKTIEMAKTFKTELKLLKSNTTNHVDPTSAHQLAEPPPMEPLKKEQKAKSKT